MKGYSVVVAKAVGHKAAGFVLVKQIIVRGQNAPRRVPGAVDSQARAPDTIAINKIRHSPLTSSERMTGRIGLLNRKKKYKNTAAASRLAANRATAIGREPLLLASGKSQSVGTEHRSCCVTSRTNGCTRFGKEAVDRQGIRASCSKRALPGQDFCPRSSIQVPACNLGRDGHSRPTAPSTESQADLGPCPSGPRREFRKSVHSGCLPTPIRIPSNSTQLSRRLVSAKSQKVLRCN